VRGPLGRLYEPVSRPDGGHNKPRDSLFEAPERRKEDPFPHPSRDRAFFHFGFPPSRSPLPPRTGPRGRFSPAGIPVGAPAPFRWDVGFPPP